MTDSEQEIVEKPSTSQSSSRLISATAVMAAGTASSRVLGFVRSMLLAFLLGNGTRQADMFELANSVPNSMYFLLAGGVLNTVLVPQIVRAIKHDPDGGEAYTNRILTAALLIMGVVTIALTIAAPAVVWLYSGAAWHQPAVAPQFESMIMLAYFCMPQVFFYGAYVLAGQVLNARDKFGPMMWAPLVNNIIAVLILVAFLIIWGQGDGSGAFTSGQELLLGLGSTFGIVVQAAVLVPFLRGVGYRYRPRFDFRHTGLGKTFSLAKWTVGFMVASQLTLIVVSKLASGATAGGEGAGLLVYNRAYLLWILPHSLITVSLATAMLPSASRLAAAGDLAGVRDEALRTMRLAVTVIVPAAVAFIALAHPITRVLFGIGQGAADAPFVGWTLMAFAIGLVPFTLNYICLRAFYALEDTRSPFFQQLVIAAVNMVLALAFVLPVGQPRFVAAGLGLAYSCAYLVGLMISFRWLGTRLPGLQAGPLLRHCVRLLAAVAPAGLAAFGITWAVAGWSSSWGAAVLGLSAAGIVAVGLFFVFAKLLRISEIDDIIRTMLRRGDRGSGGQSAEGGDSGNDDGDSSPTIDAVADPDAGLSIASQRTEQPGTMPPQMGKQDQVPPVSDRTRVGEVSDPQSAGALAETTVERVTIPAGTVLAGRYRLEEMLAESAATVTWRAFDQVLSRSVLCHLLPPGDPREERLLAAARRASAATDSRFLRVLDAVPSTDPRIGSYIVCEYATGQSLEIVLNHAPLSGLEAAWLVHEVADAMAGVHSLGLFHQRINPDTVIITPTGNIKIVGLVIEEALRADRGGTLRGGEDPQARDVLDLGRLLYAALVSRWPGGPAFGLADAPSDGRHWLTPRQVRAGVSPALDRICDQILGDPPRHKAESLTSANAVVNALTKVLGTADASADLERRLRQPIPVVRGTDPVRKTHDPRASVDQPTEELAAIDRPRPRTVAAGSTPTTVTTRVPVPPKSEQPKPAPAKAPTKAPAAPATPEKPKKRRRWVGVLILLVVLLVLAGVIAGAVLADRNRNSTPPPGNDPSATQQTAPPAAIEIASGHDFDPQGDDKTENPDEVHNAYDGNTETRWRTLEYKGNPKLGGIKRGVGLVLDLGSAQQVRELSLLLSGNGTKVEARIPKSKPSTVAKAPMKSDKDWKVVGKATISKEGVLEFDKPVNTRFVLVYLTSLPREGSNYRGGIYEVEVRQ